MSEDEAALLAAWEHAWRLAQGACASRLARLRRGEGRWFGPDDLRQELFLEFWAVWRVWRERGAPEEELWRTWDRRLFGGALHILRQPPYRLLAQADPAALHQAAAPEAEPLPTAEGMPWEAHAEEGDPEQIHDWLDQLDELDAALGRLRPTQRVVLYLGAVAEASVDAIAQRLRLRGVGRVRRLLKATQRRLVWEREAQAAERGDGI